MSPKNRFWNRLWFAQKFLRIVGIVGSFYLASYLAYFIPSRSWALRFRARNLQLWSYLLTLALGIRVTVRGRFHSDCQLIISNHLSYVDVLILSASMPVTYITSREVFEQPVQGNLCRAAGCLFVERRKRSSLTQDIGFLGKMLSTGARLVLFAEGTSSNGQSVLKFRSSLLEGVNESNLSIQPLCFNYTEANGEPLTIETRDSICYYGEMGFFSHLLRLISLKTIRAELNWLEPVESRVASDRKALTQILQERVQQAHKPFLRRATAV